MKILTDYYAHMSPFHDKYALSLFGDNRQFILAGQQVYQRAVTGIAAVRRDHGSQGRGYLSPLLTQER